MSKYTFSTLAIGSAYNFKVRTLIDCVLILTKGDFHIITDDPDDIKNYLTSNPHLDESRVFIHKFDEVSSQNPWFTEREFNFNLKRLPTQVAYEHGDYDMIVHADADAFFIGWDEENFVKLVESKDRGLIARFRNRPCEEVGIHFIIEPKARNLSLELIDIKAPMPIEVFMLFKPKCPEFPKFMEEWKMITERCYNRGVNPFIEALEISYAISVSKLPHHTILNYMRDYPSLHTLRYLHHDKIMRII